MPATAKRIETLTKDQEAMLPIWRARYLERGTATGPCDRSAIETAVAKLYESCGYKRPELMIWMDSPLGGIFAAGMLAGVVKPNKFTGQLWDQLRGQLWDQLGDQFGGQLWDQLRGQLWDQLGDQFGGQLWDQLRGQLTGQLYRAGYGQQDGHWISWLTFGRHIGAVLEPAGGLDALDTLCDAGWWWPFQGAVVLTDRPTQLHRDDRGNLHSESGPAIAYADGHSLWAIHGVRVPQDVVEVPEKLTIKRVTDEANAEVRRVMIGRYGRERYLREANAKVVHRDEWGTLWQADRANDNPLVMIELLDATPGPDGKKVYFVPVPPPGTELRSKCDDCAADISVPRTAHAAVAWGYGRCAAHYQPAIQS